MEGQDLEETVNKIIDAVNGKSVGLSIKAIAIVAAEIISRIDDTEEKNIVQIFITKIIQDSIKYPIKSFD